MRKGARAHLFCSSSRLWTWVRTLGIEKKQMDFYDAGGAKNTVHLEFFQCEKKGLVYVKVK